MNSVLRCLTLWSLTWTSTLGLKMQCLNKTCTVESVSLENYVQTVDLYRTENFDPLATTLIFKVEKLQTIPILFMNDFSQLETVRANNSNIYILHATVFGENHRESFKYLKNLFLDHNTITTILDSTFAGAEQLRILQLSYNQIFAIETFAFKGLKRLNYLDLSNNCLQKINWTIFADTHELEYLNLEHNQIHHFQIEELHKLRYLYIDYFNGLAGSRELILDSFPQLTEMGIREHHNISCEQLNGYLDSFNVRGVALKDTSDENANLISRCVFDHKTLEQIVKYSAVLVLTVIFFALIVDHYRRRRLVDSAVDSKMTDLQKV